MLHIYIYIYIYDISHLRVNTVKQSQFPTEILSVLTSNDLLPPGEEGGYIVTNSDCDHHIRSRLGILFSK